MTPAAQHTASEAQAGPHGGLPVYQCRPQGQAQTPLGGHSGPEPLRPTPQVKQELGWERGLGLLALSSQEGPPHMQALGNPPDPKKRPNNRRTAKLRPYGSQAALRAPKLPPPHPHGPVHHPH